MVVAWLGIAANLGTGMAVSPRVLSAMFWIAALPLLVVPAIYLTIPAGELPHMELFAKLMIWGHPYMAPLIFVGFLAVLATRKVAAQPVAGCDRTRTDSNVHRPSRLGYYNDPRTTLARSGAPIFRDMEHRARKRPSYRVHAAPHTSAARRQRRGYVREVARRTDRCSTFYSAAGARSG